jgi:hypothetical protein
MPERQTEYNVPCDDWNKIRNRLKLAAEATSGACVLTLSILAVNGEPLSWTAPDITLLEPRRCAEELLRFLTLGSVKIINVNDEGVPIGE